MHNKVVYHAMKVLNDPEWGLGWPVLRFNFRGTGLSQGAHDGEAEAGDVLAALDWLEREFRLPLSRRRIQFRRGHGAPRLLQSSDATHRDVRALVALGLPTHGRGPAYHYSFLPDLTLPKLFLSGDHDQFAPAAELDASGRFCGRAQAPHPPSRRRSFLYRPARGRCSTPSPAG